MGIRARFGVYAGDRRLGFDLAVDKGCGRSGDDVVSPLARVPPQGLCFGIEQPKRQDLPPDERSSDGADGPDCRFGHRKAILTSRMREPVDLDGDPA